MNGKHHATGFEVRRAAAQRLQLVLSGAPFLPFGAKEIEDSRDRALGNRLVTTCLKRHGQINFVLSQILEKGVPKRSGLFEPSIRLAIGQLLFLPEMGDHAAVHLAVEMIKKDRRAGRFAKLANAVLRKVQKEFSAENISDEHLAPDWMRKRWHDQYGAARVEKMLKAIVSDAPLDLSFKPSNAENDALKTEIGAVATIGHSARLLNRDASVDGLAGYEGGHWWVQDLAASLPVFLANPQAGQSVLDICAAPGGKTAQLAASGAEVIAIDNDAGRMERAQQNLQRLQLDAKLIVKDMLDLTCEQQFDLVLLDAPCSATGTFRRHPEVIWHRREKDILRRADLQRQMLENSAKLVKPGGMLVYCTCSLEPEEGEEQAKAFLKDYEGQFRVASVESDALTGFDDVILKDGFVRTIPGMMARDIEGSLDGFFIAKFIREN